MQKLTPAGENLVNNLSNRYNISNDAVIHMIVAVNNGGGSMAQFSSPELGGSGQWMRGGMTMVGDMFNNGLKATVDGLCYELSNLINQGGIQYKPLPKVQNQNGFMSGNAGNWWGDLGFPNSTGSQNNTSYAIFSNIGRLAIQENGQVTVFDTLDHQIGGTGQQQGGSYSVSFTSQYGNVDLNQLPIVSGIDNKPKQSPVNNNNTIVPQQPAQIIQEPIQEVAQNNNANTAFEEDIFMKIEKIAGLKDKGILTAQEFENKKADLLSRL